MMSETLLTKETSGMAKALNSALDSLSWEYIESDSNQYIEVNDNDVMVFDKKASPFKNKGSAVWMKNKHANGKIHEPATVASFVCMQNLFSHRINNVFDIGALYGYFSVLGASLFEGADVVGFEMNTVSYEAFKKNAELNQRMFGRNISCANMGLSDVSTLSLPVVFDGFMLTENTTELESEKQVADVIDIYSLDDFCKVSGKKPDLIKMDVEGYQVKIIPGAMKTIAEHTPAIIMEFDGIKRMQEMQGTNKEIADYFFDIGYRCWWIGDQRNGTGKFEEITSTDIDASKEVNSLAVFVHEDWLS